MENIVQFVTEYSKRLARPIKVQTAMHVYEYFFFYFSELMAEIFLKQLDVHWYMHIHMCAMLVRLHVQHPMASSQDLEDVRSTMAGLDEVRAVEIEMDMELGPIEECYSFLQRCGVAVPREEMERVDSLRYTFKNLQAQSVSY